MKKLIAICLILALCLSLAACGGDETGNKNSSSKKSSASEKKEEIKIYDGAPFSDGVAVVKLSKSYYPDPARYGIIDKKGNIVGEFEDLMPIVDMHPIDIHNENYVYRNGVMVINDIVYDKTGKVIASPEISGYTRLLTDSRAGGNILAIRVQQAYEGDKIEMGVLNNKGEWIIPLSKEHPFLDKLTERKPIPSDFEVSFVTDKIVQKGIFSADYYYNLETFEVTEDYEHYGTEKHYGEYEVYHCNKSGEISQVLNNTEGRIFFDDAFLGKKDEIVGLYDYTGKKIIDFSGYDIFDGRDIEGGLGNVYGCDYADGYLGIFVKNSTGSRYFCLYNNEGELVFDPVLSDYAERVVLHPESNLVDVNGTFYDFEGNALKPEEGHVRSYGEGLLYVRSEEGGYYMNSNGKRVIG